MIDQTSRGYAMKEEGEGDPRYWLPHGTPIIEEDPRLARRNLVRIGSQLRAPDGTPLDLMLAHGILDEGHHRTGRLFQQMRHCALSRLEARTGGRPPGDESPMDGFDYFRVRRLIAARALPLVDQACFHHLTERVVITLYGRRGHYQEAFERLQDAIRDRDREKRNAKKVGGVH